jgi:hypothetical protein
VHPYTLEYALDKAVTGLQSGNVFSAAAAAAAAAAWLLLLQWRTTGPTQRHIPNVNFIDFVKFVSPAHRPNSLPLQFASSICLAPKLVPAG